MSGPKISKNFIASLVGAEELEPSPMPTRWVSNGEYLPLPVTRKQHIVAAKMEEIADSNARRLGISRRDFLRGPCEKGSRDRARNNNCE